MPPAPSSLAPQPSPNAATTPPGAAPTILLHGFTGAPAGWDPVLAAMARPPVAVVPWLPGHHPDAVPLELDFLATVRRLAEHLAKHAGGPLIGYSLGGRLALALVASGWDCSSLTLIGAHPGLADDDVLGRAQRARDDARWAALARQHGTAAFIDAWSQQPLLEAPGGPPGHLQPGIEARRRAQAVWRLQHAPWALAAVLERLSLARMPSFWAVLPNLPMPVHFIAGRADPRFAALAERAAAMTPGARLSLLEGCGHSPLIDAPAALACIL